MVSKPVYFLAICVMILTGITKVRTHPALIETNIQSCNYKGKRYEIGEFFPQENCTMLCFCNGYGPPSPCFTMCPGLPEPTCEIDEELYRYNEENEHGCSCEMTACRKLSDD